MKLEPGEVIADVSDPAFGAFLLYLGIDLIDCHWADANTKWHFRCDLEEFRQLKSDWTSEPQAITDAKALLKASHQIHNLRARAKSSPTKIAIPYRDVMEYKFRKRGNEISSSSRAEV